MIISLFLFLLFQEIFQNFTNFSYTDELTVLFLGLYFALCVIYRKINLTDMEWRALQFVIVIYILGASGAVIFHYQNQIFTQLLSGLFTIKAFISYFGARALFQHFHFAKREFQIFLWILETILTLTMLLLFYHQFVYPLFPQWGVRFLGIHTTPIIFSHPVSVSCVACVMMLLCVFLRGYLHYKAKFHRNIFPALIIILFGGRYKTLGFWVLFCLLRFALPFIRRLKMRHAISLLPFAYLSMRSQLVRYLNNPRTARWIMLIRGIQIGWDHFPLGAGFGTYGSEFSRRWYSPLYDRYALSHIYGISRQYSSFICDNMWATILGETGYFGTLAFVALFICLFAMIRQMNAPKNLTVAMYGFLIFSLFESIGSTVFMAWQGEVIFMACAFCVHLCQSENVYAYSKKKNQTNTDELRINMSALYIKPTAKS